MNWENGKGSTEQGRRSLHKGTARGTENGVKSPPRDQGGFRPHDDDGGVAEMEEIHLGQDDSEVMITAPIHSR